MVEREENRILLGDRAQLVWLDARDEVLLKRRAEDATSRPLLAGADPAEELSLVGPRRRAFFQALAGRAYETEERDILTIAQDLAKGLRGEAGAEG